MKICNKCSVANDDSAVFCVGCGELLPKTPAAPVQPTPEADPEITRPVTNSQPIYAEPVSAPVQPVTPQRPVPPVPPAAQPVASQRPPVYQQPPMGAQPPFGYAINPNMLPIEYQPVTMGEYILYGIGFGIPVVGLILMIITAFGNGKKISLKNYAKVTLIFQLIGVALSVIMIVAFAAMGISMYDY